MMVKTNHAFNQRSKAAFTTIDLPWPISANALTKNVGKRRADSERYTAWKAEAGAELLKQRPKAVEGHYAAYMRMSRKDNRRRDLSNHYKCVSDLLVEHGVIEDDSLEAKVTLEWSDKVDQCEITIIQDGEPRNV